MTSSGRPGAERHGAPRPRRLKIALVVPVLDVGGAERVVMRTAARLPADRFDPILVGLSKGPGRLLPEAAAAGLTVACLHDGSGRPLSIIPRFARWVSRERPHVVMSFMFHANVAARVIGRALGVPVIITSERIVGWESTWRILVNRRTAFLSHAMTTNSQAGVDFWSRALKQPPGRISLIDNGVDLTVFSPPAQRAFAPVRIGNIARLHAKNRQTDLLAAARRLADLDPRANWELVIAGDGPEARLLERLRGELGLADRVRLMGHVDQPAALLHTLHIYVQSSIAEGMPNAVLEAMATGLPVVATAVGGTPEVVTDGVTGQLVPAGSPENLADALHGLLHDPERRDRWGRAGRARVEAQFSVDRMVDQTAALIERVWDSRHRR